MTHCMVLDTHKVMKQFHGRPHQGKPMTWLPKKQVTVGVKWNLAKKDYVPDTDNWVYRTVALRPVKGTRGRWEVLCEEEFWPAISSWLRENCL